MCAQLSGVCAGARLARVCVGGSVRRMGRSGAARAIRKSTRAAISRACARAARRAALSGGAGRQERCRGASGGGEGMGDGARAWWRAAGLDAHRHAFEASLRAAYTHARPGGPHGGGDEGDGDGEEDGGIGILGELAGLAEEKAARYPPTPALPPGALQVARPPQRESGCITWCRFRVM
jgi:hypothetical protein